jgi:hypothetical protein
MMLFEAKAIQREFNGDTALDAELLIGALMVVIAIFAIALGDSYSIAIVASSLLVFAITLAAPVRWLEIALFVLLSITCAIALIEYLLGIAPLAWTGNINLVGYLASILLIMALARRNATIILVSGFALAMVNCAGAILCVIVIVLYCYRHQRLVVAALLAVGLVVLAGNAGASWMRLVIWNVVITSPGVALPYNVIHTHNAVLQMMLSWGIIPAVIVTVIAVCALVMLVRLRSVAAVGAFVFVVISSMVDYIYWYPGIAAVVVCYLIWIVRSSYDYA